MFRHAEILTNEMGSSIFAPPDR